MNLELIESRIESINQFLKIRVMLPDGYKDSEKKYPVLYVNDGQDVFRDEYSYQGVSFNYEKYYSAYKRFLPEIIIVAVEAPEEPADRTRLYSPYHKSFIVPAGKKFESEIKGNGKEYLDWLTKDLKKEIDAKYRTLPDRKYTGICGYSTGGLNSIYALLAYPDIFTRLIAMSAATFIWIDKVSETMEHSDYDHIKSVYIDVGTNEFGRMTTREEFLEGTKQILKVFNRNIEDKSIIKFNQYEEAVHHQKEWAKRFPDALRWIYRDF